MAARYRNRAHPRTTNRSSFNRQPLQWAKRTIEDAPSLDPVVKSHALLWLKDIRELCPDNPVQQSMARAAVIAYAHCVQAETLLLNQSPDSEKAVALCSQVVRYTNIIAKCLRLAGLKRTTKTKGESPKSGHGFTPPRAKRPYQSEESDMAPLVLDDSQVIAATA